MDRPERKVFGGTMVGVGAREKPAETKKPSAKKPKAKEADNAKNGD